MKKLLFIIPPYFNADDYVNQTTAYLPAFTIPYGILSMQTYLNNHLGKKVEIDLLDLNLNLRDFLSKPRNRQTYLDEFDGAIIKKILDFKPDICGISALFNSSSKYIENIASLVKRSNNNILVIAGGGLPSAAYHKLLDDCPNLDAVCKGEGELPLRDLLQSTNPIETLNKHKSWINREGIAEGKIPDHTFINNLDEIPFLNYDLVNLDDYNNRGIDKRYTDENIKKKREMAIHTSRGCPFLCVFCSNPSLHGRDVRYMSVEKVISDVRRMKESYGMTVLMIEDDHFFNDPERAKNILNGLAELDIRIEFPNGLAVYAIDDEMAICLKNAGVSAIALAVESGSDYVLNKIIKKPLKIRMIKPAVEALRRNGVKAHVFIVAGLPGETDAHREETVQMLLDSGFDWAHIYLAIPIFGSRLYDICIENGYIENQNTTDHVATKAVIKTPTVDPAKLEKYAYRTQLLVNFVQNHNMLIGRHEDAIPYFENVVGKYPNHGLGHYYLSQCYAASGQVKKSETHSAMATQIFMNDEWWSEIAREFGLVSKMNDGPQIAPSLCLTQDSKQGH